MKTVAISCGDPNGIGVEILLKAHSELLKFAHPLYCVHYELLEQASKLLSLPFPQTLSPQMCIPPPLPPVPLSPALLCAQSGRYSYESFLKGIELCEQHQAHSLLTLPIHKQAWNLAGISALGHTQLLSKRYNKEAIMMLGCEKMYIALYTNHIPLAQVPQALEVQKLIDFFKALYAAHKDEHYCVMGINPHCGDGGIMGQEDALIQTAIQQVNAQLKQEIFKGPYPADCAFIPMRQKEFRTWVAMYHDIGLAPLKALYFEESINVSLDIPILRTSVDHGVAFDIAYQNKASLKSYLNALQYAIRD